MCEVVFNFDTNICLECIWKLSWGCLMGVIGQAGHLGRVNSGLVKVRQVESGQVKAKLVKS